MCRAKMCPGNASRNPFFELFDRTGTRRFHTQVPVSARLRKKRERGLGARGLVPRGRQSGLMAVTGDVVGYARAPISTCDSPMSAGLSTWKYHRETRPESCNQEEWLQTRRNASTCCHVYISLTWAVLTLRLIRPGPKPSARSPSSFQS